MDDERGLTQPTARLLDVSRLLSRAGRVLTGIDRVEAAYLDALLADEMPLFGLARTRFGFLLLDREGLTRARDALVGQADWLPLTPAWLRPFLKNRPALSQAEAGLRSLARKRCLHSRLGVMLHREMPAGLAYLNTGHTCLVESIFRCVKLVPGARISVLIHDMIPLDFPDLQRPGTVEAFHRKMRCVSKLADLVICNSDATRRDVERHFGDWGHIPPIEVAHLGHKAARPDPGAVPSGLDLSRPYFVALGTIEPRKNHALLLDLWDSFAAAMAAEDVQQLFIIGSRGWRNEDVFERLDALPEDGPVRELAGLSDGAVAALLEGANGLLMPSLAEGFGLPLLEAAALSTPILAGDLPVYKEFLGNIPVYAPVTDRYQWDREIRRMAGADPEAKARADKNKKSAPLPTWAAHFNRVLKLT